MVDIWEEALNRLENDDLFMKNAPKQDSIERIGISLVEEDGNSRAEQGELGELGEQGEQGELGEPGEQGEQGEQGELGEQGEQGELGEPGELGTLGEPLGTNETVEDISSIGKVKEGLENQKDHDEAMRESIQDTRRKVQDVKMSRFKKKIGSISKTKNKKESDPVKILAQIARTFVSSYPDSRKVNHKIRTLQHFPTYNHQRLVLHNIPSEDSDKKSRKVKTINELKKFTEQKHTLKAVLKEQGEGQDEGQGKGKGKGKSKGKGKEQMTKKEILRWNIELRNFLLYSNRHWRKRYPQFRANYQGDKAVGYALAKDIVSVPKQYKKLRSLNQLTEAVLEHLPTKSFVIKETLGHAGNRVLCLNWDPIKQIYIDYLHHSGAISRAKLITYITKKLDRDAPVIIEELLPYSYSLPTVTGSTVTDSGPTVTDSGSTVTDSGPTVTDSGSTVTASGSTVTDSGSTVTDSGSTVTDSKPTDIDDITSSLSDKQEIRICAPPPDFKVYVVLGTPRLINVYFRLPEGRYEAVYTPTWERIPIKELYQDLVSLQYQDLPDSIGFTLPSEKTRKRLLEVAKKLAREHDAKFVRYDFYIIGDRIVLGEITPLCGGIRNNILKKKMLMLLFPPEIRKLVNSHYKY